MPQRVAETLERLAAARSHECVSDGRAVSGLDKQFARLKLTPMTTASRLLFVIIARRARLWLSGAILSLLVVAPGLVPSYAGPDSASFGAKRGGNAFAPNAGKRSATITGQAFVITIRGRVTFAVGARVSLVPVTPTTTPLYEHFGKNGEHRPARALQFSPLARTASADEEGRFEFTGLAPGDYYLVSHLAPGVHTGYAMLPGGVVLHNRAQVEAGESREVMLTAQVQPGVGFH